MKKLSFLFVIWILALSISRTGFSMLVSEKGEEERTLGAKTASFEEKSMTIGNVTIQNGSRGNGILSVTNAFPDGSSIDVPFVVIRGMNPGPTLHLQPGQHGEEGPTGLEAIRRVFSEIDPKTLNGVLQYCLPNPIGFREPRHFLTTERLIVGIGEQVNLNRLWPGKPSGSVYQRLVNVIWEDMIKDKADCVIDFHSGDGLAANPNWVMFDMGKGEIFQKTRELSIAFGTEYLLASETPESGFLDLPYGSLSKFILSAQCITNGIPSFAPEGGVLGKGEGVPRFGFDDVSVEVCVRGIKNVMKKMGMIAGNPELPKRQIILATGTDSVIANNGGVFAPSVRPCSGVKKDDVLGIIYSPRTFQVLETIKAPADGIVWGMSGCNLVNAGDSVMSLPRILETIENF